MDGFLVQCAISTVAVAATAAAYYVISHRLKSTSSRRSLWDFVAEGGTNQKLLFILDLYQKDRQLKQTQPKFKDLISKIEDIEIAKDVSLSDDGWNIEVRVRSHIIDEIKITTSDKESPKMIDNVIYVTSVSFDGTSSSIDNGGKTSIAITNAIQRCLEQCIHDSLGEMDVVMPLSKIVIPWPLQVSGCRCTTTYSFSCDDDTIMMKGDIA